MNGRDEEIGKVQTGLWMAEKLARLCREILRARDRGEDAERIAEEIESLVQSEGFRLAVESVSREYFYPNTLRAILRFLEDGRAETVGDALRLYKESAQTL